VAIRKTKKSWWLTPLLAVVLIYAAFTFTAQSNELYILNLEIKQLEQKIAKEEEEKQRLMKERDEISSDESIEKIAREKLGMVKDGERVFVDTNK
jgi:cell division protein FtsL